MTSRADAKRRSEMLKELRTAHAATVERTQARLKEQKKAHQAICQVIRVEAHTVPEIAAETGIPAPQVLWYLTAGKKYGEIAETGMCGSYYLYQLAEKETR